MKQFVERRYLHPLGLNNVVYFTIRFYTDCFVLHKYTFRSLTVVIHLINFANESKAVILKRSTMFVIIICQHISMLMLSQLSNDWLTKFLRTSNGCKNSINFSCFSFLFFLLSFKENSWRNFHWNSKVLFYVIETWKADFSM